MDPRDGREGQLGHKSRRNKLDITQPELLAIINNRKPWTVSSWLSDSFLLRLIRVYSNLMQSGCVPRTCSACPEHVPRAQNMLHVVDEFAVRYNVFDKLMCRQWCIWGRGHWTMAMCVRITIVPQFVIMKWTAPLTIVCHFTRSRTCK